MLLVAKALWRGLIDVGPLVSLAAADLLEFRAIRGFTVTERDVHELVRLEPTVGLLARLAGAHGITIRRVPGGRKSRCYKSKAGGTVKPTEKVSSATIAMAIKRWRGIEPWQVPLWVWGVRKERLQSLLRRTNDPRLEEELRAWGGMTTDYAHRHRVEEALRMGKAVPAVVLADYPDLMH